MPDTDQATAKVIGGSLGGVSSAAAVGELLGDGRFLVAVGATQLGTETEIGEVALFPGNLHGEVSWDESESRILAEEAGDIFGADVHGGRDVTADGVPDLLLASRKASASLYLLHGGAPLPVSVGEADTVLRLGPNNLIIQHFLGDLNHDGTEDYGIGSPVFDAYYEPGRDGLAWIVHGPGPDGVHPMADAGIRIDAQRPVDDLGRALHGPGDLDGDGVDDLVISAPGDWRFGSETAGMVYLLRGPLHGPIDLATADLVLGGECLGDSFGYGVTSGDFDGDAHRDLLVSARYAYDNSGWGFGKVYTYLGADLRW